MKLITKTALLFAAMCLPSVASAADPAKGKASFGVCSSCHGAKGEGVKALNGPALAGQDAWYIERQLKNFKAGIRGTHAKDTYGAQMKPMAMTLADDAAVANVAAYIATLPAKKKTDGKGDAAKGKAAFAVCGSCHGANAKGNKTLNGPNLTVQSAWYLKRQLKNFKAGIRGTHAKDTYGAQMKPMAMTLADDAAIDNVIAYIQSLK